MYIRQLILFSFKEIIKFQQKTRLELILSQINVSQLANAMRKAYGSKGPRGYDPETLIYFLIAMQVEKIQTIKDLVLNPKENPVLRYYCGFEVLDRTPSESIYSRFFDKLSAFQKLKQLFCGLVTHARGAKKILSPMGEKVIAKCSKPFV